MAKVIKYRFLSCEIHHGPEENGNVEQIILDKSMVWNPASEELARQEAWEGKYTIEDDGQGETA